MTNSWVWVKSAETKDSMASVQDKVATFNIVGKLYNPMNRPLGNVNFKIVCFNFKDRRSQKNAFMFLQITDRSTDLKMNKPTRSQTRKSGDTSSLFYKPKWRSRNAGSIWNLTITAFWARMPWMSSRLILLRIRFLEMPWSPELWWDACARCCWTVKCLRRWEPKFLGWSVNQESSRTAAAASIDSWTWRIRPWTCLKWCCSLPVKRV